MSGRNLVRTDRTMVVYEKQEIKLVKTWDIPAVYAWIDIGVDYIVKVGD